MVERHYFGNRLLKSFDFNFGFCMPSSTNTCEHIYEMPQLTAQESKWTYHVTCHVRSNFYLLREHAVEVKVATASLIVQKLIQVVATSSSRHRS